TTPLSSSESSSLMRLASGNRCSKNARSALPVSPSDIFITFHHPPLIRIIKAAELRLRPDDDAGAVLTPQKPEALDESLGGAAREECHGEPTFAPGPRECEQRTQEGAGGAG